MPLQTYIDRIAAAPSWVDTVTGGEKMTSPDPLDYAQDARALTPNEIRHVLQSLMKVGLSLEEIRSWAFQATVETWFLSGSTVDFDEAAETVGTVWARFGGCS